MQYTSSRPGYIFLIGVLTLGAIGTATVSTLLLLGWAAEQNGYAVQQSNQALENAQTCIERGLRLIRADPAYAGNETFEFTYGSCRLLSIGGAWNDRRTLCAIGFSGNATRRIEVKLHRLLPSTVIDTWRETTSFTLCS